MGCTASVISPLEQVKKFVLAEHYKTKVNENTKTWIGVATLLAKTNDGVTNSSNVKVFREKDPHRKTVDVLGLVKIFTDGDAGATPFQSIMTSVGDYLEKMEHQDIIHYFKDEDESKRAVESIFEGILPQSYVHWSDWDSLQTQSQLAFQGMGQRKLSSNITIVVMFIC